MNEKDIKEKNPLEKRSRKTNYYEKERKINRVRRILRKDRHNLNNINEEVYLILSEGTDEEIELLSFMIDMEKHIPEFIKDGLMKLKDFSQEYRKKVEEAIEDFLKNIDKEKYPIDKIGLVKGDDILLAKYDWNKCIEKLKKELKIK